MKRLLCCVTILVLATNGQAEETPPVLKFRSREAARYQVRMLVNRASYGEQKTITIPVDLTYGWGCPCAPFVLTGIEGIGNEPELWVLPTFKKGLLDPTHYHIRGRFLITGRYSGRVLTLVQYLHERHERLDEGVLEADFSPEFIVESWCYAGLRKDRSPVDTAAESAAVVTRMKREGARTCDTTSAASRH